MILDILADSPAIERMYGIAAIFLFRMLLCALCVHLGAQAISSIPMAGRILNQAPGQLGMHLLVIAACLFLSFWIPSIRILHQTGFIEDPEAFIWPDIILTGLALSRLTHFWHLMYRWMEKRATM